MLSRFVDTSITNICIPMDNRNFHLKHFQLVCDFYKMAVGPSPFWGAECLAMKNVKKLKYVWPIFES